MVRAARWRSPPRSARRAMLGCAPASLPPPSASWPQQVPRLPQPSQPPQPPCLTARRRVLLTRMPRDFATAQSARRPELR